MLLSQQNLAVRDLTILRSQSWANFAYILADVSGAEPHIPWLLANEPAIFTNITVVLTSVSAVQPTVAAVQPNIDEVFANQSLVQPNIPTV